MSEKKYWDCDITTEDNIPTAYIESWKDFQGFLENEPLLKNGDWVYRGQRRSDWGLATTLDRKSEKDIATKENTTSQLERFKKAIRGKGIDTAILEKDNEVWAIGQHYGLDTPLLDWTYSPFVALFFAFSKSDVENEDKNQYRVAYFFNKEETEKNNEDTEKNNEDITIFEPSQDEHGRLVAQNGLFTIISSGETFENACINSISGLSEAKELKKEEESLVKAEEEGNLIKKILFKLYIKNDEQSECLQYLQKMNLHYGSLFPDLQGACLYTNYLYNAKDNKLDNVKENEIEKPKSEKPDHQYPYNKDLSLEQNISKIVSINITNEILERTKHYLSSPVWKERSSSIAGIRRTIRNILKQHNEKEEKVDAIINTMLGKR